MKLNLCILFLLFLMLSSCSHKVKTDDASVRKIVTVTEYLLLNQDFNNPDKEHQQKGIKKFDAQNNILDEIDFYGPSSIFGGGLIYKYDSTGRKTEEYLMGIHKEVLSFCKYEYSDTLSNKFEILKNDRKIKKETAYYDSNKNIIRQVGFYKDGRIMTDIYFKYNNANQEIERGGLLDQKKMRTNYKSYDNFSHLIEQKSIDASGNLISVEKFIYKGFDKEGNWKSRKSILNNIPHSIAFQEIEYK